ncbi:MAG: uncharacterized protein QG670_1218 [Thermoproteota archaeon]|nr:uncharacterized protein [Thermoproteota archaeon]
MADNKLLVWFEKRRMTKTLSLAQQQIFKAIHTVNELRDAVIAFSKNEKKDAEAAIQRLFAHEEEIDALRRLVFEELTKGDLPTKYREDLKGLMLRLDTMADHVKDSARSITVLLDVKVPKEILDELVEMAENLKESTITLGECIEMLGKDPKRTIELADKVDSYEEKVDEGYVKVKSLLLKGSKNIDVAVLMELRDLIYYLEHTADDCEDTADYIRVLAATEATAT